MSSEASRKLPSPSFFQSLYALLFGAQTASSSPSTEAGSVGSKPVKETDAKLGAPPPSSTSAPPTDLITCGIACLSWAGIKDGFRKTNQDSYCFLRTTDKTSLIFGVFDGHGPKGHDVARFCKAQIPVELMKCPDLNSNPGEAFRKAFVTVHEQVLADRKKFDPDTSGSTACMAHLCGRTLTVAWVGDSRAILGRLRETEREGEKGEEFEALSLSFDHKPELDEEKARIEASNGTVQRDMDMEGNEIGPFRVWINKGPLLGLAVSRSLGDQLAHAVGVSAEPSIFTQELNPSDKFFVLASDGVWEFLSNEDVVRLIAENTNLNDSSSLMEGCKRVMNSSKQSWQTMDKEAAYVDDITTLVVSLTHNY